MISEYLCQQANRDSSGDPILTLVTISHSSLAEPIRCVANGEEFVSRGETFIAYPFEFVPMEQTRDGLQMARIRIDNIDGAIIATLRSIAGTSQPPQATFEFVYASAPNYVERQWPGLEMRDAAYDDAIEATLAFPNLQIEPFPRYRFTNATHPGLVY